MKPPVIWIVTALCLALLGGAMAWITNSMLRMERDQNRMANEATMQEMARLALWRMEGIAYEIVMAESARPPEQYRTFPVPDALLNSNWLAAGANNDWAISPVVRQQPELLKLHFEMDADGTLRSPQVPRGVELAMCRSVHAVPEPVIAQNGANLAELCRFIDLDNSGGKLKEMREKLRVPATLTGNRALLWSNAFIPDNAARDQTAVPIPAPEPPGPAVQSAESDAKDKASTRNVRMENSPAYAMQQRAMRPEDAKQQQLEFNTAEERARQEFVQAGVGKAVGRRGNYDNVLNRLTAEAPNTAANKEIATAQPQAPSEQTAQTVQSPASVDLPPVQTKASAPPLRPASSAALPETAPAREIVAPPASAPGSPPRSEPAPEIAEFRPLWIGEALLLTRRVTTPQREWIQGAWLDWEKLRAELLAAVQDRFPEAKVIRAPDNPERGAHLLASLPVQLIPGAVTFPAAPFWSPLKFSLSVAWLCVLLAIAAVALVLRGMMSLSERRASFVSSVTHELRTPLATFKLYSEMLADGMVKEETKKQQYLETLTGEADRLGHLVENVLAYSRIERGKGPTAACSVRTGDLVNRIEPRLNQRTLMAGMDFSVTVAPGVADVPLRTDAGAVEQILCNLVDNACKYGRTEGSPGKVELVITRERRRLCFAVRDYGPGIPRGEQNNIFLPFHKSARDAAHSAPGVGLGLALCRRLATELRGTLEIDRNWKQGACFVLRLPV